jgi:hypothetical protein
MHGYIIFINTNKYFTTGYITHKVKSLKQRHYKRHAGELKSDNPVPTYVAGDQGAKLAMVAFNFWQIH